MSKTAKIILYPIIFVIAYLLCLYWFFPYDMLKDRIGGMISSQVGGGAAVEMGSLEPYWFTGVEVQDLKLVRNSESGVVTLFECERARIRASITSLLFGSPDISFDLTIGEGEVAGSLSNGDEIMSIDASLDDVDLGKFKILSEFTGVGMSSRIDGDLVLNIDKLKPIRSTGEVSLEVIHLKTLASEIKIGELNMPLPEMIVSKGRESQIKFDISKGAINISKLKLAGDDLGLDIDGKVFLASKTENVRFNLKGSFSASKKVTDALPFFFLIEKQKKEDGSYPISISGKLDKPAVKVGQVKLPL